MDPDTEQICKITVNEKTFYNPHAIEDKYQFLLVHEKYAQKRNQFPMTVYLT